MISDREEPERHNERPLYVIVFRGEVLREDVPVVLYHAGTPAPEQNTTWPHLLRRDTASALPALWAALHLPRNVYDAFALQLSTLDGLVRMELPHQIALLPTSSMTQEDLIAGLRTQGPVVVIAPSGEVEPDVATFGRAIDASAVLTVPADSEQFRAAWETVSTLLQPDDEDARRLSTPTAIIACDDFGPTMIADGFVARQLVLERWYLSEAVRRTTADAVAQSLELRSELKGAEDIHAARRTGDETRAEEILSVIRPTITTRAILGVSGVPSKHASSRTASAQSVADLATERDALRFLVGHTAASYGGTALVCENVPPDIFAEYRLLEDHCASSDGRPRPHYVWRTLRRIGERLAGVLGDGARLLLEHAEDAVAFSDFPIGLAILPNHTAPIMCSVPFSYQPLTPLTAAIQRQTDADLHLDWRTGIRILVAECLDAGDPLAGQTEATWNLLKETVEQRATCAVDIVRIRDEEHLAETLAAARYDAMIVSAHGAYDQSKNLAALQLGRRRSLMLASQEVPPVVILSACHVAPRGTGAVTVADLLLQRGAIAVLGTLVPILPFRNAILMLRLFSKICDAISTQLPPRTLADAWHDTMSSNAVHDIYSASRRFQEWAFSRNECGRSVDEEFKLDASRQRIRGAHVYRDTETVLREIAVRRGFSEVFNSTLRSHGYFPESLFYVFIGRPDRIYLTDPLA